ncbi:unnamed protein product [Rhizoctonia solani]|uniref:Vegetative incompatibility protein HET-E-1 n=1 Tax=Rhizoctonia solani TaxID=456999 RepID=A0A8H3E8A5_9AGAM|nr:unnamed protein product [Rhizoctonia solani]
MFDTNRSGSYFCDVIEHRQLLAERCFSVVKEQLVFNICELESSFVSDKDVDGIQERVKQNVSPTLAYACRYWANHLALASMSDDLSTILVDFFSHRLLFWMEVLNLRREMVAGIEALLKAKKWLNEAAPASSDLVMLFEDARNFITGFASSPTTISTPHIYISSLPFCPCLSTVYKNYWKRTTGLLKLKGSLMERREAAALATWNIGSGVYSLAYSPGGTQVTIGCGDNTVRILNAQDGTMLVNPLQGHTGNVTSVAFSPNGKLVASGSDDRTIWVWNAHNGTPFAGPFESHEAGGRICSVCFSPDNTKIISAYWNDVICIWDVNDGKCLLGPWKDPSMDIYACILSPNGTHLACTSPNNAVTLYNVHTQTSSGLFQGHNGTVSSLAFTPDGSRLVSGSDDCTVRVWNVSDGSLATDPFEGHTGTVNSVAVSPDGMRVASGSSDHTVRVWNINDGSLFAGPFTGHTGSIRSVTFSPDGTRIASGSFDGTVRAWHVLDGLLSPPAPFHEHMNNLISTSLFNNGTRILSGSGDRSIGVWDILCDGIIPNLLKGFQAKGFQAPLVHPHLSPTTGYFAVSDEDHCINILDANDNSLITVFI